MKTYKKLLILILSFSILTAILIFSASAASLAYGAGTVSVSALNVRTGPNTTSPISATISKGNVVVILDRPNENWYHINCNGKIGYVTAQYISGVETSKNFSATGTLADNEIRMRSTPTTSGNILSTYSAGTAMSIIGINNGWYKVKDGTTTGYIRSDFVDIGTSSMTTPLNITAISQTASPAQQNVDLKQQIAEYARQYVGYRYIYGSASPNRGFDCSGLTSYVYSKFGYSISRTASQQYKNNGITVSKADLQPGDLVFFSSNGGRSITHVGLYYGDRQFINASTGSSGVIISSVDSAYYSRVWYGAKRIIS